MTVQELFERYAGGMVRCKVGSDGGAFLIDNRYRFCGYNRIYITLEYNKGNKLERFLNEFKAVMLPGLPMDWCGYNADPHKFDWNDVIMPNRANLCSRCGEWYEGRKIHRINCI